MWPSDLHESQSLEGPHSHVPRARVRGLFFVGLSFHSGFRVVTWVLLLDPPARREGVVWRGGQRSSPAGIAISNHPSAGEVAIRASGRTEGILLLRLFPYLLCVSVLDLVVAVMVADHKFISQDRCLSAVG